MLQNVSGPYWAGWIFDNYNHFLAPLSLARFKYNGNNISTERCNTLKVKTFSRGPKFCLDLSGEKMGKISKNLAQ